jgi:hypothetical protein
MTTPNTSPQIKNRKTRTNNLPRSKLTPTTKRRTQKDEAQRVDKIATAKKATPTRKLTYLRHIQTNLNGEEKKKGDNPTE